MEERSRDVIGLLEELTEQNRQQTASLKKQLFVTRILAAAGCVLAAAVIAVFLLIAEELYNKTKPNRELCELRNMIAVAYLVIKQGREIKESVGCHYNADYPKE